MSTEESRAERAGDPITAGGPDDEGGDWRIARRPSKSWDEWLLAGSLISLGLAIIAGAAVTELWRSPWAPASAVVLLWIGMLAPVVAAFSRARPAGLLRLRAVDLLYGVVLGMGLRLAQGWIALALGGDGAWPSYPRVDGALPTGWWFTDVLGAGLVAPVIEELFFREVVLVTLFLMLRRAVGAVVAGLFALLVSTGVFVLVHALSLTLAADGVVALTLLGLTCGLLVLLTGRVWGAVLVHVVFNATYVALALIGTFFA